MKKAFPDCDSTVVQDALKAPKQWTVIPVGDAHAPAFSDADYVKTLPITFQQSSLPYCSVYSLLSALTIYGDMVGVTKILPHASDIVNSPRGTQKLLQPCSLFRLLVHGVCTDPQAPRVCPRLLRLQKLIVSERLKYQLSTTRQFESAGQLVAADIGIAQRLRDMCGLDTVLLVQLLGSDKSSNHAVAIVTDSAASLAASRFACPQRWYIIDSNEPFAVELSDGALAIANASQRCDGWLYVVRLQATTKLIHSKARHAASKM